MITSKLLLVTTDVDIKYSAQNFDFSGGEIKNAIFKAATKRAILTDDNQRQVTMDDLVSACEEIKSVNGKREKDLGN